MVLRRRRLVAADEAAVVSDYEAEVTVAAICATHDIGLVHLYRILDQRRAPRRRPNAPKLPKRLRERILKNMWLVPSRRRSLAVTACHPKPTPTSPYVTVLPAIRYAAVTKWSS